VFCESILILFSLESLSYPDDKIGNPTNASKSSSGPQAEPMAVDKPPVASSSYNPPPAAPPRSTTNVATSNEKVGPIFPIEGLNPYHNKQVHTTFGVDTITNTI
jgi:hypothetical protein